MPGQAKKSSHWVLSDTVLLDALHARFISKIDSTDRVETIHEDNPSASGAEFFGI